MAARLSLDAAETIALKALVHLTHAPDDLGRFLAQSGLGPAELKARAGDRDLLVSLLDFMLSNEALLVAFCDEESIPARDIHLARHVLGGP